MPRIHLIHLIVAARPNYMKVAPVYQALAQDGSFELLLLHTGQHYDAALSSELFRDLSLPEPDHNFQVGSGTHAQQTAKVMVAYEEFLEKHRPGLCIVPGDVNSTLACALSAAKLHVPLAHLEAGLRSFDRSMPEEVNRVLTDHLASILWTHCQEADDNLLAEGIAPERISRVGNCMIDSLVRLLPRIQAMRTWEKHGLTPGAYCAVTLHRPSNVDIPERLGLIVDQLRALAEERPLLFPMHPRTRANLERFQLLELLEKHPGIQLAEPLGYLEFLSLVESAQAVVTDSGGIQEEASYLNIPCLTLRPNTERPVTCTLGSNALVEPKALLKAYNAALRKAAQAQPIPLWDGKAGIRIAEDLRARLA